MALQRWFVGTPAFQVYLLLQGETVVPGPLLPQHSLQWIHLQWIHYFAMCCAVSAIEVLVGRL